MEQHAVPQDITGFKFKLVGSMTLKQFGELAGGLVVAYIFYATGWPALFRWPLVILFGFLGFALAFLPIEERPLDIWILNFFRSIYQPTLYVWKKGAVAIASPAVSPIAPMTTFSAAPTSTPTPVPVAQVWPFPKENKPSEETPPVQPPSTPSTPPVQPPLPSPAGPSAAPLTPISIEELQSLRDQKIQEIERQNHPPKPAPIQSVDLNFPKAPTFLTIDDLALRRDEKRSQEQAHLHDLLDQDQKMFDQIESLKTRILALQGTDTSSLNAQLESLGKQRADIAAQVASLQEALNGIRPAATPAPTPTATAQLSDQVRVVEKPVASQAPIALTDVPNTLNGLVLNERNIPVDSVILTVKDKGGNSIRALKTNQVGQFIASTPLENGTYILEFERPGYTFDTLEITLDGKKIPPLQVLARAGGIPVTA